MGGRKGGSKLTQVRHSRGRGAGWVQCRGEQLVRSGHLVAVAVCDIVVPPKSGESGPVKEELLCV